MKAVLPRSWRLVFVASALAFGAAGAAAAQIPGAELSQVRATRQALQDLLVQLETASNSSVYSSQIRTQARAQANLVRRRLSEGDFQVGDRIMLRVEGETSLTDTFTVQAQREVVLPTVGAIPLGGVLRVELNDFLTQRLAQFIREPRVRAQALIRVAVIGAVARQGFYTVPVDVPVNEVLQIAGGLAVDAELDQFRIERGLERIYTGADLQRAVTEGRTLDAMSIQAGDRFVVPARAVRNPYQFVSTLNILLTIPFTIAGLVALIRN